MAIKKMTRAIARKIAKKVSRTVSLSGRTSRTAGRTHAKATEAIKRVRDSIIPSSKKISRVASTKRRNDVAVKAANKATAGKAIALGAVGATAVAHGSGLPKIRTVARAKAAIKKLQAQLKNTNDEKKKAAIRRKIAALKASIK